MRAVFIQAGGAADRIGELDAERLGDQRFRLRRQQGVQSHAVSGFKTGHAELMGALGIQTEQEIAG